MGRIEIGVDVVDSLNIRRFPTRPIGMDKIVRDGNMIVAISATGKVYASDPGVERMRRATSTWSPLASFFRCLIKLKLIDESAIEDRDKLIASNRIRQDAKHALEYDAPDMEKLGVKLTAAQRRRLERIAEGTLKP